MSELTLTADLRRGDETAALLRLQERGILPDWYRQIGLPEPNPLADEVANVIRRYCLRIFLPLAEQFQNFLSYNRWLKEKHPEYTIPDNELQKWQEEIARLAPEALLFYCHNGDVVLTAKLAWEYTCSYRQKTWRWDQVRFEENWMRGEGPVRPKGFYTMRRPPEDTEAIGKKFQGRMVCDVRQELGNDWGIGAEGLQFVGITHPHYPELMDGDKYPFIDLPGLAVAPGGDGDFYSAPCLSFGGGGLRLGTALVDGADPRYGSGFLQQC